MVGVFTMTRKHYRLLANAIKRQNEQAKENRRFRLEDLIIHTANLTMARIIADVLKKDNPRFNRTKFMEACGFDE
jgi:hypothetical protein